MEKSRIYFRDRESRRGSLNGTRERERIATTRWKIYVFSRGDIGWILLNLLELNAVGHLRKGKLEGRFIPQLFRPACAAIIFARIFYPIATDILCFLLREVNTILRKEHFSFLIAQTFLWVRTYTADFLDHSFFTFGEFLEKDFSHPKY